MPIHPISNLSYSSEAFHLLHIYLEFKAKCSTLPNLHLIIIPKELNSNCEPWVNKYQCGHNQRFQKMAVLCTRKLNCERGQQNDIAMKT